MVPFHTLRAVRSLKLRQSAGFRKDNGPENDNPSSLVLWGLRGGVVLGDGAGVRGAGSERKDGGTA
jgi:hypothetical protein